MGFSGFFSLKGDCFSFSSGVIEEGILCSNVWQVEQAADAGGADVSSIFWLCL